MNMSETYYAATRRQWRTWLEKNHNTATVVWFIFYKKHTGKPGVPYNDAVEEALCFGWIDSIVRRIDDERYAQKFTPRKANSKWSETNIKRIEKLIAAGLMTERGQKLVDEAKKSGAWDNPILPLSKREASFTPEQMKTLSANTQALENFNRLPPSQRKQYTLWITSAKKEETQKRRLNEAIQLLEQGKKLGMK